MAETRNADDVFNAPAGASASEDVEVIEGALKSIGASSTLTLLDGGRTWNDLIADYSHIRFEFIAFLSGFDHYMEVTVRSSDLSLNGRVRAQDGDSGNFVAQLIMDNAFSTGDATGSFNGWTSQQVRVIGIRPQTVVVDPAAAVVDDQLAAGFFDVGTMRIQVGTGTSGATSAGARVNFPQPFAAPPRVFVTDQAGQGSAAAFAYADAVDTTGFDAIWVQHTGSFSAQGIEYFAIGLKP